MAIVQAPHSGFNSFGFKSFLLMGLIAVLTACGGGGKSKDTTPNALTFTAVTNAALGAEVTSNAATVSGINSAAAISITGGQYAVNNGAFTSAAGKVTNGQTVTVKVTAAATTNTPVSATVNVGGTKGTFTVTTLADLTPNAFSFAPATAVEPASVNTSAPVTVSGFDLPVPVSVSGGEYSINGGAYTTAVGTMSPNQTVTVRVTAAATTSDNVVAVLTVGGVEGTYTVTTLNDEVAPTAEFMFPPPVSMTEGTTLLVRGKVADDYNTVANAQIIVNGAAPQDLLLTVNEDGSASWQMEVALTPGENTIAVATEDSAGNTAENAAQVSVRQDVALGSFPDAVNPMPLPKSMVVDKANSRNRLIISEGNTARLFSVDLATGSRSLLMSFTDGVLGGIKDLILYESANQLLVRDNTARIATIDLNSLVITPYDLPEIGNGFVFVVNDTEEPRLMAANGNNGNLVAVPMSLVTAEVFSDNTNVTQGSPVPRSLGIAFDKSNQRYLISSYIDQSIYAVNSVTGARSIFSGGNVGSGVDFSAVDEGFLGEIEVDTMSSRVLAIERPTGRIYSIDMETRDRTILSSPVVPNIINPMARLSGIAVNSFDSYAYVADELAVGIFAVDLVTGHRVYFSKN